MNQAPSGEQYTIQEAGYTAVVTELGATLRTLHYQDRPLLVGFAEDELRPQYRGAWLAPWPNRIADGRYEFRGVQHQLPINEPELNNAIHGLVAWLPWQRVWHAPDRVELAVRLLPQDGYPFWLELTASYTVSANGLHSSLEAHNYGPIDLPYGCAPHPYLYAGSGTVDDWTLYVPAASYLELSERDLPIERRDVAGTPWDFRSPRRIGEAKLDVPYTSLEGSEALLHTDDGHGVALGWDESCSWLQVFTSDFPGSPYHRRGLAVEPMTCPHDAFNSGTDVVVLGPGDRHRATWSLRAL